MRTIEALIVRHQSGGSNMKFTPTFDNTITFVDFVDDERVKHYIKFNGESDNVHARENVDDNTQPTKDDAREEQHVWVVFVFWTNILSSHLLSYNL